MPIPSTISGTVRDAGGRPVAQARVYFVRGPVALQDVVALTNEEGEFVLSAPAEGTYEIGISADGFAPAVATAAVRRGQATRLELQLDRPARR